jgi:hypothetical protein
MPRGRVDGAPSFGWVAGPAGVGSAARHADSTAGVRKTGALLRAPLTCPFNSTGIRYPTIQNDTMQSHFDLTVDFHESRDSAQRQNGRRPVMRRRTFQMPLSIHHSCFSRGPGEPGGTSSAAAGHRPVVAPTLGAAGRRPVAHAPRYLAAARFFLQCRTAESLPSSLGRFSSSSPCPSFAQGRGTADFLAFGGGSGRAPW